MTKSSNLQMALTFRVGILTCSTRYAKKRGDESGEVIARLLTRGNLTGSIIASSKGGGQSQARLLRRSSSRNEPMYRIVKYQIVPDNFRLIAQTLKKWADKEKLDLILTCGGTGFSPTDLTPEATKSVIDREAPGLAEAMRLYSSEFGVRSSENKKLLTPNSQLLKFRSFLSRGICGIRKKTLIINLPGSPSGAKESLEVLLPLLPHALELLQGLNSHH